MITDESNIESYLCKRCRELHDGENRKALCLKCDIVGFVGMPDRMILLPYGRIVFVELKRKGKTERKRQGYVQGLLRELGFTVYSSVSTKEQVDDVMKVCKEWILKNGG